MEHKNKAVILLVDDTPANVFVLQELLGSEDRLLLKAETGKEALKIALNEHVDLIILDVQMPGMDGFEVAQILKSNKKTKDIPIIFATAIKKEQRDILKGFEEGAIDYLSKPLDPEITKAKVSVFLQLQLQKKELQEKNLSLQKARDEIKLLNNELQKNVAQLEAANKEMEAFSYSVSHDLKAPLRSMIGYSEMLQQDYQHEFDANGKRFLTGIYNGAARMGRLIDCLLDFSRLGKKPVTKSIVDMESLVKKVIDETNAAYPNKASITVGTLQAAHADAMLLSHVWTNLISNAVKYSSKKEEPLVEIGCERHDDEIVYHVKDNGAGFSMEYAHKLFGVFQRLHSANEFEGTGIGLAIIQRIVQKHGGRVWAEAEENKGACFYFSLPVS